MDLLYPYYVKILKDEPTLLKKLYSDIAILIPMNLRYIIENNLEEKVLDIIEKFKEIQVEIAISWSHDGYYSQDVREKKELSEEYYEKAFDFITKVPGGIHPMISTQNVKDACKNFDWWVEMFKKYLSNDPKFKGHFYPGDLEVRNSGWDDITINQYLEFLKYKFNFFINQFDDFDDFVRYIFEIPITSSGGEYKRSTHEFFDSVLFDSNKARGGKASCSIQSMLTIRCSDLAIVPCHRTCYHQFIGGWFILDEKKESIIDIKPNNVGQYIDMLYHRVDYAPKCINCWNNAYCSHGCMGSQFEDSGELYLPIESVCRFQQAKTSFTLKLLIESGVLKRAYDLQYMSDFVQHRIIKLCERLEYKIPWMI